MCWRCYTRDRERCPHSSPANYKEPVAEQHSEGNDREQKTATEEQKASRRAPRRLIPEQSWETPVYGRSLPARREQHNRIWETTHEEGTRRISSSSRDSWLFRL